MKQRIQALLNRFDRTPRSYAILSYLCVVAAATAGLYAFSLTDHERMRNMWADWAYYFILAQVVAWALVAVAVVREVRPDWKAAVRKNALAAVIAVSLAAGIFAACPPYLRVLADEANLVDVSKVMTYQKKASQATMGVNYYRNFNPRLHETPPKKAVLYPFAVHLVHTLTGVRVENAYAVNFLAFVAILLIVYWFVARAWGVVWGIGTMFLVAAQPVVTQSATSAGFDLFTALFFFINFIALRLYLKAPSPARLLFVALNLFLLSHSRQECVVFIPIVGGVLLARRAVRLRDFGNYVWAFFAAAPLIAIPIVWQRLLVAKMDPFESGGLPGFTIKHFISNNLIFFKTLGHFGYFLPFATIVDALAVVGVVFFADRAIAGWKMPKHRADLAIVSLVCVAVFWTIFTSYFRGMMDHPSNSRYYTLFFILLSVVCSAFLREVRYKNFEIKPAAFLVFAMTMFFIYNPQTVEDRFSRSQSLPREYVYVRDFLKRVEKEKGNNFLVVAERPGLYTIHDWGSVHPEVLNQDQMLTENWRMNLFDEIYVVQEIDDKGKATKATEVDKRFHLEPVENWQNNPEAYLRISRVKNITANAPPMPEPKPGEPPPPPPGMSLTQVLIKTRVLIDVPKPSAD